MKKQTKKKSFSEAMHTIKCSKCGTICASASERSFLPAWTTCRTCHPVKKMSPIKPFERL